MKILCKVYIKLKVIAEMENYKFEVMRVTHLTVIDTVTPRYFVILYVSWNSVTSLADAIFGFKY